MQRKIYIGLKFKGNKGENKKNKGFKNQEVFKFMQIKRYGNWLLGAKTE